MNDLDFFADHPFENYLLEDEKVVWTGRARPLLQEADWLPSLFLFLAGIPTCLFFLAIVINPLGGDPLFGLTMGGMTVWLWSTAVLRPIWLLQNLKGVRYAVTTHRALVLHGVAYRHRYPLARDPIELRAVSLDDLSQRIGPDENGTLTLGVIKIYRYLHLESRAVGFYACDEVEGAEIEILRLRGELPVPENRDFDEIPSPSEGSPLGLALAEHRRNNKQ